MVNAGEDVSCRNLYTPLDPRVTSVPEEFMTAAPFVFAATAREVENPWRLLEEDLPSGAVPAILDYAAARWILHKGLGDRIAVTDGDGVARELEIVGLLSQSIFQNEVLVSPARFRRLFGGITGFAQVLVATPVDRIDAVRARLAADLVDFGVSVEPTNDRLAAFAAIADSYIDAFTALGQLGLLLGTLGLVVVLLRTAAERRGELALLSAVGLRGRRIALVLTAENAFVLAWGFVAGIAAAAVAVWPELAQAGGAASSALATVAAFLAMAGAIAALLGVVAAGLVRSIGPADLRAE
jgi:ABC-type antimicrobial peptide transport system permease subunit